LMAFNNVVENGGFVGGICDPMRIVVGRDGYLALEVRS